MEVLKPALAYEFGRTLVPAEGLTLTGVVFDVVDEQGATVQAEGAGVVVDGATGSFRLAIAAPATTLPEGKTRGARLARYRATFSDGSTTELSITFVIRDANPLVVGENTFATFLEAELIAFETAEIPAYMAATPEDRQTALMSAREDLCKMSYRYEPGETAVMTRVIDFPGSYGMSRPAEWTAEMLATLPPRFLEALKRAQVIQANHLLGGNPEERAGEHGLLSKTVAEASEMFRPGMGPIQYPVCKRAMLALRGFTTVRKWHIARG